MDINHLRTFGFFRDPTTVPKDAPTELGVLYCKPPWFYRLYTKLKKKLGDLSQRSP